MRSRRGTQHDQREQVAAILMSNSALLRCGDTMAIPVTPENSSMDRSAQVGVVPYALVYIDNDSAGSPNNERRDAHCYIEQSITLHRSLLAVGLPGLNIVTNVSEDVQRYLSTVPVDMRPRVVQMESSISLPRGTRFYSAHFKLDMLTQIGRTLPRDKLLMLLDTDMIAMRPLDPDLLQRCYAADVGAFDISDQEFSAYGNARVIRDLETVAGKRLVNPRWFGGELLLVSSRIVEELVACGRQCYERYREAMHELNHNGDEAFISAALNLLSEQGRQIVDVGAHRLVGRHWSGNTHRDMRWFKRCSLLHLPGCKPLLERQARRGTFSVRRVWHRVVLMHTLNRLVWPLRCMVRERSTRNARAVSRARRV